MIGSYVGMDIGSSTVRAVRLRRSLRGIAIQAAVCRRFLAEPGKPQVAEAALTDCLVQLRAEGWGDHGPVVVTVPESGVLARKLDLPITDLRKAIQVVPFELEDLLPIALEDVVVDCESISSGEGRTSVLAMAVRKEVLERRLEALSKAGFQLRHVTVRSLALRAYYDRFVTDAGQTVVLMNVESDFRAPTITLCAMDHKRLCGVRTIVGSPLPYQDAVFPLLSESVVGEIRRTIQIWEQEIHQSCSRLYLSGPEAEWPEVRSLLAEQLGIPAVEFVGAPRMTQHASEWKPDLVVATGLAAMGADRPQGRLDFARGRARPTALAGSRRPWASVSVGAALVLVLAVASLFLHYRAQEARYEQSRDAVRTLFRESFSDSPGIIDEPRQARRLLAEAQKRRAFLGIGDPRIPQILAELTTHVPEEAHLEIHELAIEADRLWFEAETESFESVDRLKTSLARSPYFREISVKEAKLGPVAPRIRFRMHMVVGQG